MGHTPFGYKIENGKAVINEPASDTIRELFENYLSGMSLVKAAREAGLKTYHGTAKRILQNRHYLGDDFYPAIIGPDAFNAITTELERRAKTLGRLNRAKPTITRNVPTAFYMRMPNKEQPTPLKQAEYLYSLIELEVSANVPK